MLNHALRRGCCTALLLVAASLVPAGALAYDYRVTVLVDDEDDILELLSAGEITSDEYDTLMELYLDKLDLNRASRRDLYNLPALTYGLVDAIIAQRTEKPFTRVSQLKKVPGIDEDIYVQVKPFVRVVKKRKKADPKKRKSKVKGQVRAQVVDRIMTGDDKLPEAYVRVKATDNSFWDVGAAINLENTYEGITSLGNNVEQNPFVVDDEGLPKDSFKYDKYYYLKTGGEVYRPAWPKVYARFDFGKIKALAGSYRVGFGQRLIFDSIGRQNPYGFTPDLYVVAGEDRVSLYKGQFGAVATLPLVEEGGFRVEATPFFSWWQYDSYQYDMRHRADGFCMNDDNAQRGAESDNPYCYEGYAVLTPYGDQADTYQQLSFVTIPRAYSELVGGANMTLFFGSDSHVGLTAYASNLESTFGDDDARLYHTEFPERTFFAAFGLDAAYSANGLLAAGDEFSLFAEGALMDNLGYAGLARALWEVSDFVFEGSARYYDQDYNNPHSRAYAMSDEFEGSRRAGELGGMLSLKYSPAKWLQLRIDEDIWQSPVWQDSDVREVQETPWRMNTYLRVDTLPIDKLRFGAFFILADRDLTTTGTEHAYSGGGDGYPRGEKYQWGVQASTRLVPNTAFWLYYKQSWVDAALNEPDDADPRDERVLEHYGVAKIQFKPLGFVEKRWERALIVDARAKYFEGNIEEGGAFGGDETSERYVEGYVQLSTTLMKKYTFALRGAIRDHFEKENQYGETTEKATEWFYKATVDVKF